MTLGPKVPTREQSRCDALGLESRLLEYKLVLEYQLLKYKLSWYSRTSGLMYQLPSLYSRIVFTLGVTYIYIDYSALSATEECVTIRCQFKGMAPFFLQRLRGFPGRTKNSDGTIARTNHGEDWLMFRCIN